ncbi:hypothetical protein [Marinobacter salarius]|uniref:hypothetical protein n=1 Tax=Marinobacter salarius TaxID=1420917 RepID=UPI0032EE755A
MAWIATTRPAAYSSPQREYLPAWFLVQCTPTRRSDGTQEQELADFVAVVLADLSPRLTTCSLRWRYGRRYFASSDEEESLGVVFRTATPCSATCQERSLPVLTLVVMAFPMV